MSENKVEAFAFGPILYASSSPKSGRIAITIKIGNLDLIKKVISGELRGLSPTVKIKRWECSICHQDFERCPHEVGKTYENKICSQIAMNIESVGTSFVDVPKDPRCRITDLLLIKERNRRKVYDWYGFKVDNENDRFRNIKRAFDQRLIPEKALFHFSKLFAINLNGKEVFP